MLVYWWNRKSNDAWLPMDEGITFEQMHVDLHEPIPSPKVDATYDV